MNGRWDIYRWADQRTTDQWTNGQGRLLRTPSWETGVQNEMVSMFLIWKSKPTGSSVPLSHRLVTYVLCLQTDTLIILLISFFGHSQTEFSILLIDFHQNARIDIHIFIHKLLQCAYSIFSPYFLVFDYA